MDAAFWLDAARGLHFVGIALGLGLALCADILAIRAMAVPVRERDLWLLHILHRAIVVGLVLLWASGLYLLWVRTGFDVAAFTPKLMVKLGVVILLTLNAHTIGTVALPAVERSLGLPISALALRDRVALSLAGGLSLTCWLSALALGTFSGMKHMSFEALQAIFAPAFLLMLIAAAAVGICAGLLRILPRAGSPERAPA